MNRKNIILILILFMLMVTNVKAECKDEELNEYATKLEATFTLSSEVNEGKFGYAYFLSVTPLNEKIKIRVIDGEGHKAEGQTFSYLENENSEKTKTFYGVGCYNNLEEETYIIEVYGSDSSKCKNELLKRLNYTVPRFNRYINRGICATYPDHELCAPYTNATKNMTQDTFDKILKNYDESMTPPKKGWFSDIKDILKYLLYIIVPFVIITIVYVTKIKKYKKEERMK